jgi:hypothetical protein
MEFEAKLTLDGLMTLMAGIIAFIAVIIQIRSSSKQVQDQLKAQRDAEREGREGQKKAVATALLFEIDSFYRLHVRETNESLRGWSPTTGDLFEAKSISPQPFPVYNGNASVLGSLDEDLVFNIVEFYGAAAQYLSALRDYKMEFERPRYNIALPRSATGASAAPEAMARSLLHELQQGLPRLINFAFVASKKLCEAAHVEFRAPFISIAAENLSVEAIAAAQKATNAQTH